MVAPGMRGGKVWAKAQKKGSQTMQLVSVVRGVVMRGVVLGCGCTLGGVATM